MNKTILAALTESLILEARKDKGNELKNKIVAENNEWVVYSIDTPEEAYLFKGKVEWPISSGAKATAKKYFNEWRRVFNSIYFVIVRKNPIGDEYDYILDQYCWKDGSHNYWDAQWDADDDNDSPEYHLDKDLNVPSYENAISNAVEKFKSDAENEILSLLTLNDDGTYSYDGSLDRWQLKYIVKNGKFIIKFKEVGGDFICSECGLTSLEGCPEKVGGSFYCSDNKLTTLKGAPEEVGESFSCNYIKGLTSLEGAPKYVGGDFDFEENGLTSLKGLSDIKIYGGIDIHQNKLTSLEGCPQKVRGYFRCFNNKLTSLEGAPKEVSREFNCALNNLTSLKGAPEYVGGYFDCDHNKLTSLEGAPEYVGGNFECRQNKGLKSLDGIGKVKGKIISDIKK